MDHKYWLDIAEEDWTCIRNELNAENKPWSVIAFHADLAAEKYLKAFLSFHDRKPEKIHDLSALLKECLVFDSSLSTLKEDCSDLSMYAIDARYPEIPSDYTERIGRESVAAAERICAAIRGRVAG